jgi:acetyltransferase
MSLDRIMNARSVAIVGASRNPTKRGYQAIRVLLEEQYEGKIYPVNPKEERILGLSCHAALADIDAPVDLALICTPAKTIPAILEACGEKGVAGAVLLAGGFGETGEAGRQLEDNIVAVARAHGIRLVGPNTSGMLNLKSNMNLVGLRDAPEGNIALLTQSGNMALTLIMEAKIKSQKGFSYYVGVGNEADIKFHEYLEFFRQDPDTRAILMYVEGMREGREFLQQAYKTTIEKPVILLKSGRSSTGKRSAGSHTGALAGMSQVAKSALQRAGVVVIENSDELFPVAEALSSLPAIRNNRVAILADGGGHATIAADLLTDHGVQMPELSAKTQEKLGELLPPAASVINPVDVAGGTDADPSLFADCARVMLQDPNVGGLLLVGLFGGYGIRFAEQLTLMEEDAAHQMGKMVRKYKKPIVVHSLYASEKPHPLELLRYYDIPVHDSLDVATKCLASLAEYGNYRHSYHAKTNFVFNWGHKAHPKVEALIAQVRSEGRTALLENEAKELLKCHQAPVSMDGLATTADEAADLAEAVKGPVAMKVVSPQILHKSDAGGVKLGLTRKADVRKAYNQIVRSAKAYAPGAEIRGAIVAPMAHPGVEVIIGTKIDDQFGPVIMYGLGGVMVEILKDVSFRVLPISRLSAKRMTQETLSSPILDGVRGNPPHDRKALIKLLLLCSDIVEAYPDIAEMDLNPVIVHEAGEGLTIVDARILLKSDGASGSK